MRRAVGSPRAISIAIAVVVVLGLLAAGVRKTTPAVSASELTIATVVEGPLVRQARGHGSFVSSDVQIVVARVPGTIVRVWEQVGATLTPETILVELTNPELEQAAVDAKLAYGGAMSGVAGRRARAVAESLDRQSAYSALKVDQDEAQMHADIAAQLAKDGVGSHLDRELLARRAANLSERMEIERRRLEAADRAARSELQAEEKRVAQLRAAWILKEQQMERLYVRAGRAGSLQELAVEPGQSIAGGAAIGKIVNAKELKVRVAVPEADARRVYVGAPAAVDVGNRLVPGRVTRIDPSVSNGDVSLDITLAGRPPADVRPDTPVDATIDVERVPGTLKILRPATASDNISAKLFKLDASGSFADRVEIAFGRASVSEIEVLSGARKGDRLVIAYPGRFESKQRMKIR